MFHGSMVALVTPFVQDQVDVEGLRALVEFHIKNDTQAIVAAGTTGESGTLSDAEKQLVIKTVVDAASDRIPVIAGTSAQSTKGCIALTQQAMALGVDGVLIMTPAYIRPTQEGLYQHYSHIAKEVAIPMILYNVPHRTACDLLPETIERLSKLSNIIGIKEATGRLERLQAVLAAVEGRMDVYSGDDTTAAEWLLSGAKGVISVAANVVPKAMAKLCDSGLDKDQAASFSWHERLLPLFKGLGVESNPIPIKWAMALQGLIQNELRLPLTPLDERYHSMLKEALRQLND